MLYITGNSIKLTRGDTAFLTIDLRSGDGEYTLQPTDKLTLSIKKYLGDESYRMQKTIIGTNVFHIEPSDTKDIEFGPYKYDIQLTTGNGDVYTIIPVDTFEILSEVTCE